MLSDLLTVRCFRKAVLYLRSCDLQRGISFDSSLLVQVNRLGIVSCRNWRVLRHSYQVDVVRTWDIVDIVQKLQNFYNYVSQHRLQIVLPRVCHFRRPPEAENSTHEIQMKKEDGMDCHTNLRGDETLR